MSSRRKKGSDDFFLPTSPHSSLRLTGHNNKLIFLEVPVKLSAAGPAAATSAILALTYNIWARHLRKEAEFWSTYWSRPTHSCQHTLPVTTSATIISSILDQVVGTDINFSYTRKQTLCKYIYLLFEP